MLFRPLNAGRDAAAQRPYRGVTQAFTLIEIMVVVAIMGLILAAGVPSLYGFFHKEGLRKSMSDLMDTCNSARQAAIMSGKEAQLVIHPREGTCEVRGGNGKWGGQVHAVKLEGVKIYALQVNNSQDDLSQNEEVDVTFFPNGTSEEMTMLLLDNNNQMKGITLEITTGIAIPMRPEDINGLRH